MVYESVTFLPGWDQSSDECIERLRGLLAPKCAVFLFVEGDQVFEATNFLFKLTEQDHGAYVFKLWQRQTVKKSPKTTRQGPRGCVVSDTVQIWAIEKNRIEMHAARSLQSVTAQKPTVVMDHIADHVNTDKRVAVLFGDDHRPVLQIGSTEFDIFSVHEDKVIKKKAFSHASTRKSRMLKAYIERHDAKQLDLDRKALTDPTESIVLSGMIEESGLTVEEVDKMLKSAATKKRRQEKRKSATPAKERSNTTSGIAAMCQISDTLRDFLVEHCDLTVPPEGIARTEVVRAIPAYIKKHNLSEGRKVTLDDNLQTLVRAEDIVDQEITFFTIYKFINHNFVKKQEKAPVPEVKVPEVKMPEVKVPQKRKAAATQKGQAKKAKSK